MVDLVDEFTEKWTDVKNTSDDRAEKTLIEEFLDDLKEVNLWLARH